jgi:hypothetical protein
MGLNSADEPGRVLEPSVEAVSRDIIVMVMVHGALPCVCLGQSSTERGE